MGNLRKSDYLEDVVVDGKIILALMFNESLGGRELD